jgi:asparagine synthase (glutamine-hydrolysing)
MLCAIAHRGPDGSATLIRGNTGLVHLRLAIVDLQTGDQPLFGATGAALVANGEIYNDPELRRQMTQTKFNTRSDCEPAIFLAESDGLTFVDRLRGMYAIAIHDFKRGRLVLSRDIFGIKPLYYISAERMFLFASEPCALLATGVIQRHVDANVRSELLQLKFTTGRRTIFPDIYRVLPGESLVVENGRIVDRRYKAALPEGGPKCISHREAFLQVEQVLIDSVKVHLRSDVPYGLFLSGGIDSAALLALMRRATGQRIQTLSVGWNDAGAIDETREAMRLARLMGADCHHLEMTMNDFWNFAPQIAAAVDDPTTDAAVLPSWMLGRAAAGSLKVTLCGEGADELFGGYGRYRKRRVPWRWLARRPHSKGLFGELESLRGWHEGIECANSRISPHRSEVQRVQEVDILEWLPNDLLIKLDRTLMVHGVEGRTPFLDRVVADFAFCLPDREKAGLRFGKRLLRDWLAGAFPEVGAYTRKRGFKPPVGTWMAKRYEALSELVARQVGVKEMLHRERVRQVFSQATTNPQPAWSLLFYALWHNSHILCRPSGGDIGDVLQSQ